MNPADCDLKSPFMKSLYMNEIEAFFPQISTEFCSRNTSNNFNPNGKFHPNNMLYTDAVRNILENVLPKDFFENTTTEHLSLQKTKKALHELLPLLTSYVWSEKPLKMSFFVLSKYRSNAFRFFFEMISHWLIPGKRLNVLMIYAADFNFPEFGSTVYTACEMMIQVQSAEEYSQIMRNLPIIETEIRLGMQSSFYSRRILEVKGLSADEKTALIQEHIAAIAERLPTEFDQDVLTEMQHVLVMCRDDFKAARDCRLLSRIITVHYLFRKNLRESVKIAPTQRHLSLKFIKSVIDTVDGPKKVLGMLVGINFLKDKEVFEQKHLMNAIRAHIPDVQVIENSFFANRRGTEHICTFYLEIEKEGGGDFTSKEIQLLRQELPSHLKDSIEHLMHPVFMPRNEEEIMRNILSLGNQIKYLRDIPQVYISFDEQTHANLFFTVILVRVLKPNEEHVSIQDMFKEKGSFFNYIHDRSKTIGYLRKKYPKEATVFRAKALKEQFLRRDHSINLYEARQAVVLELLKVVGDFRDFNGGIISKQTELVTSVKSLLEGRLKHHDLLLENFFYSLNPVIMRTVLQPEAFKTLFNMLLDAIPLNFVKGQHSQLNIVMEHAFVFILVKTSFRNVKDSLHRVLAKQPIHSSELCNAYVQMHGIHYIGYIYRSDDAEKQHAFCQVIQEAVASLENTPYINASLPFIG
jgi:hypothetical protein